MTWAMSRIGEQGHGSPVQQPAPLGGRAQQGPAGDQGHQFGAVRDQAGLLA